MEIDRMLADLLPKYPIIWDRSRKDFRDNNKKGNAFKALAQELNIRVDIVMARYKAIREKYRKEKVKMEGLTKSGYVDTWELFHSLSFFDGVMMSRKRASNVILVSQGESSAARASQSEASTSHFEASSQALQFDSERDSISIDLLETTEEATDMLSPMLMELPPAAAAAAVTPMFETPNADHNKNASGHGVKRPRQDSQDVNHSLQAMLTTLKDTAELLRAPSGPVAAPSRFDWLGKYIAAKLNEMDPVAANEKCDQILAVLLNKK